MPFCCQACEGKLQWRFLFVGKGSASLPLKELLLQQNMKVEIVESHQDRKTVVYDTVFDTLAGEIRFENEALFVKGDEGVCADLFRQYLFCQSGFADRGKRTGKLSGEAGTNAEYWISGAFSAETAARILEDLKKVVNDPNGTGYGTHREDFVLAGKTGTAEIKASQTDSSGTELGWFAVMI